jgi:hypothetical protein
MEYEDLVERVGRKILQGNDGMISWGSTEDVQMAFK